jgi:predicted RecA/RadA family phage recombinase
MSSSSFSTAYLSTGSIVSVTAPYALVGGQGCQVGDALFGVAVRDVAIGEQGDIARGGKWVLAKNPVATAVVIGARLYWDNTHRRLDTIATSNLLVGVCVAAAGATDATVTVVLTGQV